MRLFLSYSIFFMLIIGCSSKNNAVNNEVVQLSKKYGESVFNSIYMDSMAYYEKASFNGKYIMYNEAYGYMLSEGENASIPIDNFYFICTNFGKSFRNSRWLDYLENTYAKSEVSKKQTDIQSPGYQAAINSFRRFELSGPLNPEYYNEYEYSIIEQDSTTKKIDFASKTISNVGGTIFYDDEYQISKIYLNNFKFYSEPLKTFKTANLIVEFGFYNQQTLLSSVLVDFKDKELQHIISIKLSGKPTSKFQLTENDWNILFFNDCCPFVEYVHSAKHKFLDDEIDNVRKDLEADGTSLEDQFIANNGTEYYEAFGAKGQKIKNNYKLEDINRIKEKLGL